MRINTFAFVVFVVCMLILTYLLLMELPPSPHPSLYKDKCQHLVAFAGVTFWGLMAFGWTARGLCGWLLGYGALMEALQTWLTLSRQASVFDWLADGLGVLLAWQVVQSVRRWRSKRYG